MIYLVSIALLAIGSFAANIPNHENLEEWSKTEHVSGYGRKWVVLVAGSSGWDNYRHQVSK